MVRRVRNQPPTSELASRFHADMIALTARPDDAGAGPLTERLRAATSETAATLDRAAAAFHLVEVSTRGALTFKSWHSACDPPVKRTGASCWACARPAWSECFPSRLHPGYARELTFCVRCGLIGDTTAGAAPPAFSAEVNTDREVDIGIDAGAAPGTQVAVAVEGAGPSAAFLKAGPLDTDGETLTAALLSEVSGGQVSVCVILAAGGDYAYRRRPLLVEPGP